MRASRHLCLLLAAGLGPWLVAQSSQAGRSRHETIGRQYFLSPQSNPIALSPDGSKLYVAATTSDAVDVINTATLKRVKLVEVGMEPVSVAVRPDGLEVWVSNHVSDSVSVIDTDPSSPTYLTVVETIQDIDASGVTQFDEPVGIAFASNTKAYVALSSRNDIAIVDGTSYSVTGRIHITSQEPRAIAVRNGMLFVTSFESGDRTQMSFCNRTTGTGIVGDPCSMGLTDLANFVTNPNLPTAVKNIVTDTGIPDRDLFVFRTSDDSPLITLSHIGTLLYGIAVDGNGKVFITQTDARNGVNGNDGLLLSDLQNRMFNDQIATTTCTVAGSCTAPSIINLDPPAPTPPTPGHELSTPYGIAVSGDNQTVVGTSAGNSRLFTMTPGGTVEGILDLGSGTSFGQQIPRGVALLSGSGGAAQTAYVLNTLENTVSVVDVSNPASPVGVSKIFVGNDPTPDAIRRGAIAFHDSFGSSSGTFSCASCHPDGNMDQLVWRIGGNCAPIGCNDGDEPRSTMPIRGLKNTLPLHWDGTLGDPFGGGNGAVGVNGNGGTDCVLGDADGDHDCFLDLVQTSLAGVMCDQGGTCPPGGNELSAQEQDDMATFLASVSYPPARSRPILDNHSAAAVEGFKDFFTDQGGNTTNPNTCADSDAGCHQLPLGNSTNSATLNGFDAPTMRGLTDRWVQFSMAPTSARQILLLADQGLNLGGFVADPLEPSIQFSTANGMQEETTFGTAFLVFQSVYNVRPLNIFQMIEEASTQFPGAQGRQVSLNTRTTNGANLTGTDQLLGELETADSRGLVNLRGKGLRNNGSGLVAVTLSYRADGTYKNDDDSVSYSHAQMISNAQAGDLVITLTAALRSGYGTTPQPLLSPGTGGCTGCGDPAIPQISSGAADPAPFNVTGTDVNANADLFVDGQPAGGTITCSGTGTGNCSVDLTARPADGMHTLQVKNGAGPLSDELPLCVGAASGCV